MRVLATSTKRARKAPEFFLSALFVLLVMFVVTYTKESELLSSWRVETRTAVAAAGVGTAGGTCSANRAAVLDYVADGTEGDFYYHDGCGPHGTCLVDRCVCDPSFEGTHCDIPAKDVLSNVCKTAKRDKKYPDRCMNLDRQGWGRLRVSSAERYADAANHETKFWENHVVPLRNKDQTLAFDGWRPLPRNLGDVAEFGAGPYTKVRLILEDGDVKRTIRSATLLDPLVSEYIQNPKVKTTYQSGQICVDETAGWKGGCAQTFLASFKGEDPLPEEMYDTVIMVNTIEHCVDAIRVFDNIYRSLKPGGILVLGEEFASPTTLAVSNPAHPIRPTEKFYRYYLSEFFEEVMPPKLGSEVKGVGKVKGAERSLYAIVRKPLTSTTMQG